MEVLGTGRDDLSRRIERNTLKIGLPVLEGMCPQDRYWRRNRPD
jgi:hypothetical protein